MPISELLWLVAPLAFFVSAFSVKAASEADFGGVWVLRHRATFMGQESTFSEDAKDHKARGPIKRTPDLRCIGLDMKKRSRPATP